MSKFPEGHCSRWPGIPQNNLTDANRLHIEMMAHSFGTGVYNLRVNWSNVEFGSDRWTRFCIETDLSTCDFNRLTRLVISAHDRCVRVTISPCNFRSMYIDMHSRTNRGSSTSEVHPTMESAVVEYRKTVR